MRGQLVPIPTIARGVAMTILVVDDEPEYRLVLKSVLVSEGYTVHVAENGEDGFTKLSQNPVDLVISDIYMPVLDGIRFHRKVRSTPEFVNVPFLFVSAFDDQHTLDAVLAVASFAYPLLALAESSATLVGS